MSQDLLANTQYAVNKQKTCVVALTSIKSATCNHKNSRSNSNYKSRHNFILFKRKREPFVFVIMRLNLKAVLLCLTVIVMVITCAVYMRCVEFTFPQDLVKRWDRRLYAVGNADLLHDQIDGSDDGIGGIAASDGVNLQELQDIECIINQEYTVHCKRDGDNHEVYVPFSFLRHYFDISGTMSSPASPLTTIDGNSDSQAQSKFLWMHSTAKINIPKGKYDARGVFMYFENYNVEIRDRVKCISAADGVPISTQWEKKGYFYPTQIAQFALSHYSKNLTEPEPRIRMLENVDSVQANWLLPAKISNLTRIWHPKFNSSVIQYETAIDFDSAIALREINQTLDLVLSADFLLVTNSSSLMITVENRETKHTYRVHYIPVDLLLSVQDENIYYGLGLQALNKWHHLTRDLHIDVQKGLALDGPKKSPIRVKRTDLRILSISFLGVGFFDNISLSTYDHMANFYDAAEWLVNNQDQHTGGWPNPVRRSLSGFAELKAGWLSAMGQGHAISVLARAYWKSGGDKRYLKAAALGLKPYRVLSKDGGVLAHFMDKYFWYEEYPTTPASFVLNGFIYSLLGLYDLNATAPSFIANEAGQFFQQGMISLKNMLLLFDTGSGTSYDLRHLSLGVAPNLARWDYHATHVNQLLLLATIDSDPLISRTAERWKGYMFGKRAKHN
uniref:heparosan-N-sulfate-glucuronate 5-epimerase n=1 Tax=Glossina morsitans morsitans TaxID=37546 RepID=A0A1B0GDK9_GLOMM